MIILHILLFPFVIAAITSILIIVLQQVCFDPLLHVLEIIEHTYVHLSLCADRS
ncbi:protein of unknown function [Brevefilum fermentans]|uniref:Uncharacterized protein n=1 Tax=Candidatus Brevifilum fermentans TaxID=1986204 RepID=A0A1Y6K6B6_9CHLR|nr:protein of unknown function [Brevefilum fermentans]